MDNDAASAADGDAPVGTGLRRNRVAAWVAEWARSQQTVTRWARPARLLPPRDRETAAPPTRTLQSTCYLPVMV